MFRAILLLFLSAISLGNSNLEKEYSILNTKVVVDSRSNGFNYSYAPAIVSLNNRYHLFFCSDGIPTISWDTIRYTSSSDLEHWVKPTAVVEVQSRTRERAACDPSLVYFKGALDRKPYFYLFYSGAPVGVGTAMFIARSESIEGPYKKLTTDGKWAEKTEIPKPIILPHRSVADGSGYYGAGQQTIIVRGGKLWSWYTDTTLCSERSCSKILFSVTDDPTQWPAGKPTNVQDSTVDVKEDRNGALLMFSLHRLRDGFVVLNRRSSTDGIEWTEPEAIVDAGKFPRWSHNPGVLGDVFGHLIKQYELWIAYGAPYGLSPKYTAEDCKMSKPPYCRGFWDLYATWLRIGNPPRE